MNASVYWDCNNCGATNSVAWDTCGTCRENRRTPPPESGAKGETWFCPSEHAKNKHGPNCRRLADEEANSVSSDSRADQGGVTDAMESCSELRARSPSEKAAYLEGVEEGKRRALRERPSAAVSMVNGVSVDEIAEMLDSYKYAISDCTPKLDVRCERFHYIPRIEAVVEALKATHTAMSGAEPRNLFWPGCRVRHHKGGEYVVLFRADYEPTMTDCYVYRGEDGHTWVRPALQMEDGRFEYADEPAVEPEQITLAQRTYDRAMDARNCALSIFALGGRGRPANGAAAALLAKIDSVVSAAHLTLTAPPAAPTSAGAEDARELLRRCSRWFAELNRAGENECGETFNQLRRDIHVFLYPE